MEKAWLKPKLYRYRRETELIAVAEARTGRVLTRQQRTIAVTHMPEEWPRWSEQGKRMALDLEDESMRFDSVPKTRVNAREVNQRG